MSATAEENAKLLARWQETGHAKNGDMASWNVAALEGHVAFQTDGDAASVRVMFGKHVKVGSRVKHWGQRWTGCATATVVGFQEQPGYHAMKILVKPDNENDMYGTSWDWDRTEVAPDI